MRQIVIKKGLFSTLDVLKEVLLRPGPQGVTASEMRDRLRLMQLVEDCDERVLDLEDADFLAIVEMIKEFRFGVVTKDLLETVDGILSTSPTPTRPRLAS